MSQGFKSRYEELRRADGDGAGDAYKSSSGIELYAGPSYGRSVSFVWLDGKRLLMNYAYFVSAEFELIDGQCLIRLNFSSATILLRGYQLEALFSQFQEHAPRTIEIVDERYAEVAVSSDSVVIDITVDRKET